MFEGAKYIGLVAKIGVSLILLYIVSNNIDHSLFFDFANFPVLLVSIALGFFLVNLYLYFTSKKLDLMFKHVEQEITISKNITSIYCIALFGLGSVFSELIIVSRYPSVMVSKKYYGIILCEKLFLLGLMGCIFVASFIFYLEHISLAGFFLSIFVLSSICLIFFVLALMRIANIDAQECFIYLLYSTASIFYFYTFFIAILLTVLSDLSWESWVLVSGSFAVSMIISAIPISLNGLGLREVFFASPYNLARLYGAEMALSILWVQFFVLLCLSWNWILYDRRSK